MSLRIKNGRWEYRFKLDGARVQEATGLAAIGRNGKEINRKLAEDLEAKHRVNLIEGRMGIRRLAARSFSDAVEEFIRQVRAERDGSTALRIVTSMASCRAFFADQIVTNIGPGEVEDYKVWRLEVHKIKPVTLKHDLDNLSLFFKWAVRKLYARTNIVMDVERPSDKDSKREHILSDAEERLYFSHARGDLHDVGRIMILQGCRPDEVWSLKKKDIDLDRGVMRISKSKTDAGLRTLKLTTESACILGARMGTAGPWVFPSPVKIGECITKLNGPHDKLIERLNPCRACGRVESVHAKRPEKCAEYVRPERALSFVLYDLRHTFATRMIRAGVQITELMKILGHTSIKVTERYVHLAQEDMDRAMDQYQAALDAREIRGAVQ